MPYDLSIPGQVSEFQLRCIEKVAQLVPRDGRIVEVGSLFGRTAYAWAKSATPSVLVHAIDPWQGNRGVAAMERTHGITYGIDQFRAFTSDCPNMRPMQGFSPKDFLNWDLPIDLYYEDAVHSNPILRSNLDFWVSKLKPTGIVCGDDYRPRFADVVCEAQQLAYRMGRELIVVDNFWCLLPDENVLQGVRDVRLALAKLGSEMERLDHQNPTAYTLELVECPTEAQASKTIKAKFRLTNEARVSWHPWLAGHVVSISLRSPSEGRISQEVGRVPIEPMLFPPDIAREFQADMRLPEDLAANTYAIEVAIVTPLGEPLKTGRIGMSTDRISISSN